MKFEFYKTSDYGDKSTIEIESLEDLITLLGQCEGTEIIIRDYGDGEYGIEDYDSYRE